MRRARRTALITNSIPQATWRALGTRNCGEPVDASQS
jgi:hypothetical protein